MNMDRNTVSRSHDGGVYAATALASAKDEHRLSRARLSTQADARFAQGER